LKLEVFVQVNMTGLAGIGFAKPASRFEKTVIKISPNQCFVKSASGSSFAAAGGFRSVFI
jgi:hypothetical protein